MLLQKIKQKVKRKLNFQEKKQKSSFIIKPDDVFIVSYPKSGNTWARFLFANLIKPDSVPLINFHNVHDYCPDDSNLSEEVKALASPRLIKSHQSFNPSFPKVIYIVRDGRDVYISYFHYLKQSLPPNCSLQDFLADNTSPFGSWSDHIKSWLDARNRNEDNFLLVRYEDLLEDPFSTFKKMAEFAGFEVGSQQIASAVGNSSFVHMQNIERKYGRKYSNDSADSFVRKGQSGEWRECFGQAEWEVFLEKEDKKLLEKLGYTVPESII
ncbi:MAG: sulfotransferase domain-containing protein [Spirulinaceae cyanobacterium]